jgi:hypothetical protein
MVVIGGEVNFDTNDIYVLDLDAYIWIKIDLFPSQNFSPRRFHTSTTCSFSHNSSDFQGYKDKVYVFGGWFGQYEYLSDMYELDFSKIVKEYKEAYKKDVILKLNDVLNHESVDEPIVTNSLNSQLSSPF